MHGKTAFYPKTATISQQLRALIKCLSFCDKTCLQLVFFITKDNACLGYHHCLRHFVFLANGSNCQNDNEQQFRCPERQSKIYHMSWTVEKEDSCKEICSPRMKLFQRKPTGLSPFPQKCFRPVFMNNRGCTVPSMKP